MTSPPPWTSRPCPLCASPAARPLLVEAGVTLRRCVACGFVFVGDVVGPAHLKEYYDESYVNTDAWYHEFSRARQSIFDRIVSEIARWKPSGRLLDVGCSLGLLLKTARARGFDGVGVELSRSAARFARETMGLDVREGTLAEAGLSDASFDVVTLIDVLEHVPWPLAELKEIRRVLRGDGLLVVRVPNVWFHLPKTRCLRAVGVRQATGLDPKNHLNHFSPATLGRMLDTSGFAVRRLHSGSPNLYGKPLFDGMRDAYYQASRGVHVLTGVNMGNIMEAYAVPLCETKQP